MDVIEQIAKLSQELPPDKQTEVLDFVAFLVARQAPTTWTVEKRQATVADTMGCLTQTRTTSEAFAKCKAAEKAREERRWKS